MAEDPNPNPLADIRYGDLNDIRKPVIRRRLPNIKGNSFAAMTVAAADSYKPNALASVGQFKGVVLRVENGPSTENQKNQPGGWFESFFKDKTSDVEMLIEIKVRVPEIHSMLPTPSALGSETDDANRLIIDMYPTFVAQSTAVQVPEPGDLVWVDWGNRKNWSDPYYVRPVKEVGADGSGKGGEGAAAAHGDCSGNSYSAKPPSGDSVAGSNAHTSAHTGLPRLKRNSKPKGDPVLITTHGIPAAELKANINPARTAQWKKTMLKNLPPGRSWIGPCVHQGKNYRATESRSNIIWYSNSTDFKQPWELIYFFHGLDEFSAHTFEQQIAPQVSTMVSQGRNFVLVMPELPWAKAYGGKGQGTAFKKDKFALYHKEALERLAALYGEEGFKPSPAYIAVHAHSAGGSALKNIIEDLNKEVKPNRIFLSDCDYYKITSRILKDMANGAADKNRWVTCITTKGKTRKNTNDAFKAWGDKLKDSNVFKIETNKKHFWCGANCLITISDEMIERQKKKDVKTAEKAAEAKPNDEQGEENKTVVDEKGEKEEKATETPIESIPKKDPSGESPPPQTPPTAASKQSKESDTPKKPDFKSVPAVEYQENRVRTKEYGGSLVGAAADKLLEEVEPGVKLHKLVAVRYRAFKKAAIEAGFPNFKISSGWRRHRWKDRAHYEATLEKKYGSISAGKGWLAFASPHETGMALDVKAHGVYASYGGSKTAKKQKKTPLFAWMKANAHRFGLTPYKKEPWHWECRLPYDSYASGVEFTEDFAIRVTHTGGKNAQLPSGPSTGGGGGGGRSSTPGAGKRCVRTGGGGGHNAAPPGPYTPGKPFPVSGGGSLGKKLKSGPPPGNAEHWGNPKRNMKELRLFVLHETAGWPNGTATLNRNLGKRKSHKAVHFWGAINGDVVQTIRPEQIAPHANNTNAYSCGIEVCNFGNAGGDYAAKWERRLAMGMHVVTHCGRGDIPTEPGKVVPSSWKQGKAYGAQALPSPQQCDSAWKLIVWLSKNPPAIKDGITWRKGGKSGKPVIKIPITFPCVPDKDKFWWSKWNGGPARVAHGEWFAKHTPGGIVAHARIHQHHDGLCLEYYCLARARGMSANVAYYAMVGALCSGVAVPSKGAWTPTPNPAMVAIGKKKFKKAWFKQKTSKWVGKKKWKELAAANPQWFADPKHHANAGKKGYS